MNTREQQVLADLKKEDNENLVEAFGFKPKDEVVESTEKKPINCYEVRAKVKGKFLNGMVLCESSDEAKERTIEVLMKKYNILWSSEITIAKCIKKKVEFFIKKQ